MPDIATLGLRIDGDRATQQLREFGNESERTGRIAEELGRTVRRVGEYFTAGFIAREVLKQTIDAQNEMARLEAAVRSTGGAAGYTVAQLTELSESLAKVSTFSTGAVQGGLSRLLTYTGIQGEMFEKASAAALDMASALGIDVASAAERTGNALQYPSEAINSLTRQGFRFSDAQKRMITDFEESGQMAKAQAIILGELTLAYGGAAEAARGTLGGALKSLWNDLGDLVSASRDATGGIVGFINKLDDGVRSVRSYRTEIKTLAEAIAGAGLVAALVTVGPSVVAFASLWSFTVVAAFRAAAVAGTGLTGVLWGLKPAINGLLAGLGPISLLAAAGALAVYDLNKAFDDYDDKVEEASKNTKEYVDYLKALGRAHAHAPPPPPKPPTAEETERARKFREALDVNDIEIERQRALNAAHGESVLAIALLNNRYDELAQRAKNVADHTPAEIAALNARAHATRLAADESARLAAADHDRDENARIAQATLQTYTTDIRLAGEAVKFYTEQQRLSAEAGATAAQAQEQQIAAAERAASEMEQPYKNLAENIQREFGNTFAQVFRDGAKAFRNLFDVVREIMARLAGEMVALFAGKKLLPLLLGTAAFGGGGAGGTNYLSGLGAAIARDAALGGLAGGFVGYGVGSMTTSRPLGAIGGAATGALTGFAVAGPIGAATGALTGFIGGIIGAGAAAREAAKQQELLRQAYKNTQAQIAAQLSGDTLAQSEAQIHAQFDAYRQQAKTAAGSFAEFMSRQGMDPSLTAKFGNNLNENLRLLNEQEAAFIAKAKEAAALQLKQTTEDLHVRLLTAQGRDKEAAALKLQIDQQRERDALLKSFGDSIDPTEQATLALLDQVQAQEKLKAATDAANRSALNLVEGYRLQAVVFNSRSLGMPASPVSSPSFGGAPMAYPTPTPASGPSLTMSDATPIVIKIDSGVLYQSTLGELRKDAAAKGIGRGESYKAMT